MMLVSTLAVLVEVMLCTCSYIFGLYVCMCTCDN